MSDIKDVINAFRDGPARFMTVGLPHLGSQKKMQFVRQLWDKTKVKRTRKQARRIINEMTIEELEAKYAMFLLEEVES